MIIVNLSDTPNPDKESLSRKDPVSIELTATDISASNYSSSMQKHIILNNFKNGIVVEMDRYKDVHSGELPDIPQGFNIPEVLGTIYYTPIYAEKLNYSSWLATINRNFSELT